jgi:hypothetical protein
MRELKDVDLSEAFWKDIRRLRAIRRGLDARRDSSEKLIAERVKIWKRLSGTLSLRELGELSQVGHSFVKREVDKEA